MTVCRRAVGFALLVLACVWGGAFGQRGGKMTLAKLNVPGWRPASEIRTYVGPKLEEAIDGFVDFYLGFRFLDSEHRIFQKGNKKLEVFVHRFGTPEDAFGLYTVRRSPGKLVNIGDHATLGKLPNLMVWRGRYCIRIAQVGRAPITEEDMRPFAERLAAQVSGKYNMPALVRALPADRVNWLTLRYLHYRNALEQVLNISFDNVFLLGEDLQNRRWDVDCVLAELTVAGAPQLVVLAAYPNEQKAQQVVNMLAQVAVDDGQRLLSRRPWLDYLARNGKHTLIFRSQNLVAYALEVAQPDRVKALLEQVIARYRKLS